MASEVYWSKLATKLYHAVSGEVVENFKTVWSINQVWKQYSTTTNLLDHGHQPKEKAAQG